MTQRDESNGRDAPGRVAISIHLLPADARRLEELAADGGMKRSTLAAALIEEILPSVTGVRRRLQIVRKEAAR